MLYSWQGECDVLLRKYGLVGRETGSAKEWKERVHDKTAGIGGVEEITPEQSSLSLTKSLKLFITQCTTAISA